MANPITMSGPPGDVLLRRKSHFTILTGGHLAYFTDRAISCIHRCKGWEGHPSGCHQIGTVPHGMLSLVMPRPAIAINRQIRVETERLYTGELRHVEIEAVARAADSHGGVSCSTPLSMDVLYDAHQRKVTVQLLAEDRANPSKHPWWSMTFDIPEELTMTWRYVR